MFHQQGAPVARCSLAIGLLLNVGLLSHSLTTSASAKTLFFFFTCTSAAQKADFKIRQACFCVLFLIVVSARDRAAQLTHTNPPLKKKIELRKMTNIRGYWM